jgi:hypothetical protein
MIWIVGEYAERIDNAEDMLTLLLDTFLDEPVPVQLQLLTATVKLFLKKPGAAGVQKMISSVLTAATKQTDNPDLRDRAYMYWRLLSAMPDVRASAWSSHFGSMMPINRGGMHVQVCCALVGHKCQSFGHGHGTFVTPLQP